METRLTLQPGQNGTHKHLERFGKRLVCVRYRYAETELRAKVKALGAIWRPKVKLWELPWGVLRGLELEDRMVEESRSGMGG